MLRPVSRPLALGGLLSFALLGLASAGATSAPDHAVPGAAAEPTAPGHTVWLGLDRRKPASPGARLRWLGSRR